MAQKTLENTYKNVQFNLPAYSSLSSDSDWQKSGYTFAGWNEVSSAMTAQYTDGQTVIFSGNKTLYAIWNQNPIPPSSDVDWTNIDSWLPNLSVGDIINAPTAYGFDRIAFEVIDIDHVAVSGKAHTITLQTKYLLSKTDKSPYSRQFDTSSNLWKSSALHTWLNNEDAPTNRYDSFLGSFKLDATGAVKTGTDLASANAFIDAIKAPSIETYTAEGTKGTTTDKVWLPSIYEVGSGETVPSGSWGKEGHVLDKYSEAPGTGSWDVRKKTSTGGSSDWWWLRSAQSINTMYTKCVDSDGGFGITTNNITCCVSPLITLAYGTPQPIDVSGGTLTLDPQSYDSSGDVQAQTYSPTASLVVNGTTLVKDTDYTVSYSNNTRDGSCDKDATCTCTGIGSYTGTIDKTFHVKYTYNPKIDISGGTLTLNPSSYEGVGQVQCQTYSPSISLVVNGTTLVKDTDYTVSYSNNTRDGSCDKDATCTCTGIGSYTGTIDKTFHVKYTYIISDLNFVQSNKTNGYWYDVIYGNGKYAVLGDYADGIQYSIDGINWTQSTGIELYSNIFRCGCYGNQKYIVGSDYGIYYSIDGISWARSNKSDAAWYSICYGNGKYVAASGYSNASLGQGIWYSTDGINWEQSSKTNSSWTGICYGNGKYIVGGCTEDAAGYSNPGLWYSTDGINWSQSNKTDGDWRGMCYGNGKYVAGSYNGEGIWYSADGINWSQSNKTEGNIRKIQYDNGKYVCCTDTSGIWYSTDGINWSQSNKTDGYWQGICYGSGKWVACGVQTDGIWYANVT